MKGRVRTLIILYCCSFACAQSSGEIRESHPVKTIMYAGNRNFPPFDFVTDDGKPAGFDVDLFIAVMHEMKMPYRIEMMPWKSVMNGLDKKKVDVACLMFSNSRAKHYVFGSTIKYSFLYVACPKSKNPVNSLADLAGKKVVVEKGTLSDETITNEHLACSLFRVSNLYDGLQGVSIGKYDVMLCSYDAAMFNIRRFNIKNLRLRDIGLPPTEVCFAGTDERLQDGIDRALYKIKKDGTYDKIYDKWFSQKDDSHVSKIVYLIIAGLLVIVFFSYIFIHVLRIQVNHAKRILDENNERLRLALSAGGIIVWGYDVRKARYYNVDCNIFPPEGRTIDEEVRYFHPDDQERYRNVIVQAISGVQPPKSLRFRIDYTQTGNWQYIEKEITLVRNRNGIVTHIIGTHKNVTENVKHSEEMMQAQHELEREMEKAKAADRLKSEFLANMSHEIRTPLNSIVGFSSLLKENINSEERDTSIQMIEKNSDMLIRLVNDILDFSRLEVGACDFQNTTFNMSELMEVAYSSLIGLGKGKDVELKLDVPYSVCMMTSDSGRIQQIITNFVTNAFKYTENGYITMGYQCVDDGIKIFVEDTGIGIAEDKRAMVFNRFEKLGSFKQGTGLGLSICKAIVDLFDGKIGVDSVLGKGSTFWAWLPIACTIKHEERMKDPHC